VIGISGEGLPESRGPAFGERPHHGHRGAGDRDRQQKSEEACQRSAQRQPALRNAQRHHGRKQQRGEPGQRHAPAHRIHDATKERQNEVSGVSALQIAQVDIAEAPRQRQRVVAILLQAARIQVRQVVILRVIVGHVVDVGETQSGQSGLLEEREIGIVGQQLVSFVAERRSDRMGRGGGEFADDLPLPSLVSNIMAGPLVPRASKFITRPICLARG
jgi:hypothetical protein